MRTTILTFLLLLAAAAPAAAAPGALTFDGCLGDDDEHACAVLPGGHLIEPDDIAISPDGRSAYVGAREGRLLAFARDADGALTFQGCFADGELDCVEVPESIFGDPRAVVVSPDGRSVYLALVNKDLVAHFVRGADGTLAYGGCVNNDGTQGCQPVPDSPFKVPSDLAVSPDGASLYVTSRGSHTVSHLFRSPADGALSWNGCAQADGDYGCAKLTDVPLGEPSGVAVSPDNRSVYVAARVGSALVAFDRAAGGEITYDSCVATNKPACVSLSSVVLGGARDVVVGEDGQSVYVASAGVDSVAHFGRDPQTGAVALRDCFADISVGCGDAPGRPLTGANALALAPGGRSLYVSAGTAGGVAHFTLSADGALTFDSCIANDDGDRCAQVPRAPLVEVESVAASPDGASVYAAGVGHSAIVRFRREGEPGPVEPQSTPEPGPGATPSPTPEPTVTDTDAPVVSAVRATRRGVRFRLSEAAAVTVRIRRGRRVATVRRDAAAGPTRVRRRLRRGRYRITVVATDAAGNRARPVAAKVRVR